MAPNKPLAMFIAQTEGDIEALQRAYDDEMKALAGKAGRGVDWGVPLAALVHICAFSGHAMYEVNVFPDEEIMRAVVLEPERLPEDLRFEAREDVSMWSSLGLPSYRDRWDTDEVRKYRVGKVIPPLESVLGGGDQLLRRR